MSAAESPVHLSKQDNLVYTVHDYGTSVYGNEWLCASDFPRQHASPWDQWWGYLDKKDIAPS